MRKITPCIFKKFRVFLILLLCSSAAFAQVQLTGKVTDAKTDAPLQGVTVTVKGTKKAVQTSGDGTFTIDAPNNSTLVFTSVGFEKREARAAAGYPLDMKLPSTTESLEQVIVVGYGTQRKKEVTGAISRVSAQEITAVAAPSFEASLQGRVAGVQVSQSSGLAGSGSYVRIRGIASVSAGGDPLYVIDGIPVSSDPLALEGNAPSNGYKLRSGFTQSPLASINPDDIESIEVLKDAGAAGIYGSRGANGVILITTKRGKAGRPKFNFSTKIGFTQPSVKPKLASGAEWLQLRQEAYENDGHTGAVPLPNGMTLADAQKNNTDWFDLLTHTGMMQDYNLSMVYGLKKFKSYLGGTYGSDESYAIGNKFNRASIRGNFDYTFNPMLKAILNSSYSSGINYRIPSGWAGGIGAALSEALPIYAPYKADGSYTTYRNPLIPIKENKFRSDDKRFLGGLSLVFTPLKNLDLKATGNLDNYQNITDQFNNAKIYAPNNFNSAERWKTDVLNYNFNATANYRYEMNASNTLTFLVGGEFQSSVTKTKYWTTNGNDSTVVGPFYQQNDLFSRSRITLPKNFAGISRRDSTIADKYTFISYFARANYAYKNKLFLQLMGRVDGSSKFGPNNRFGFFPTASAGYVLSDESFFKTSFPMINYFKLRTSYGITGNSNIPSFNYLDNWNVSTAAGNAPYNGQPTLAQTHVKNPDLKWETANNFDAGIEFALFKNKISGEVAYYNKLSKDVLMNVGLEEGYGIGKSTILYNFGEVTNHGVELSLSLKAITKKDFTLTLFANAAHNTNKVLSAGGYAPDAIQSGTNETRVLEGYPLGTSYTIIFKGVDPADGLPIWLGADGKLTKVFPDVADGRRAAGKLIPDWTGGFGGNVNYKGFELRTLFAYSTGLQIWDNSGKKQFLGVSNGVDWNVRREFFDRWQNPGDVTMYPRMVYDKLYPGVANADAFSSSLFLYKADYLRMRELTLAYNFAPAVLRKLKMTSLKVFVTGTNLLLWTKYKGGDPEVNRDADGGSTDRNMSPNVTYLTPPQAKVFQFGLNLNF